MRCFILFCCGWLVTVTTTLAAPLPFVVDASSYLVQVNNQTRWEFNSTRHLAPASLTKIMTVLLLLEHYEPQHIVHVSAAAARETGSKLGLRAGEAMRLQDLLAASLLNSANDACHALADHIAGDEASFVRLMNQRAQDWGLRDTHFTNACGHDDVQHYSSALDMSVLAHKVMNFPLLMGLMAAKNMRVTNADGSRRFSLTNKNALIGRLDGAIGMKSGYTPKAGKCLVALVRRDCVTILLVMLHAANRWWDASDALEYAYAQSPHN